MVTVWGGKILKEVEGPLGRPWRRAPGNLADATQQLYQIRTYCQVIPSKWFRCLRIGEFMSVSEYSSGDGDGAEGRSVSGRTAFRLIRGRLRAGPNRCEAPWEGSWTRRRPTVPNVQASLAMIAISAIKRFPDFVSGVSSSWVREAYSLSTGQGRAAEAGKWKIAGLGTFRRRHTLELQRKV
jgi:hypothetical protein